MSADVKEKVKLLAVDDDPALLRQLQWGLDDDFDVVTATTAREALAVLRAERPALVTLDLALTEGGGTEEGFLLLEEMLAADRTVKIVLITGNDTRENALQAVDRGAFDFFAKPVELDELRILLNRAAQLRALEMENARLQEHLRGTRGMGGILGESEEIQKVFQVIQRVAGTDVTVLITGESGTEKEPAAREIHRLSPRRDQPFIPVLCGAVPEEILASELFDPAPEGAGQAGAPAAARLRVRDGATIFLDEIGDLTLPLQRKLLEALRAGNRGRPADAGAAPAGARVLAATGVDLDRAVERGRFLADLRDLLAGVVIRIPPLRERHDDCLLLAHEFLDRCSAEYRRGPLRFSRDALRTLQRHDWPGNVRELEQRVQRAVIMSTGRTLRPGDLELVGTRGVPMAPLRLVREQTERQLVIESLKRNCGNITRAAKELDVSRPTYHDLLRKYQIRAGDYKDGSGPE